MDQEKKMISRIVKKDTEAFSLLVDQYQGLIFHVVGRMIKTQEDIEDVCQEVFVKIYRSIGTFKYESKLSTWIARIAYLTSINYLKKQKRDFSVEFPESIAELPLDADNPEEALNKKDISEYVNRLIMELPEHYRVILTLYHLEEFSVQEIEDTTGMPNGTIKNYLHRARKLLKDKVKYYLNDEHGEK